MRQNRLLKNGLTYHVIQKNACTSIRTLEARRYAENQREPDKGIIFTVIRHPCDRLVSAWTDKGMDIHNVETFAEWIEWVCKQDNTVDAHVAPQYRDLPPVVDYVLDFARLEQELAFFDMEIPHCNPSKHHHWEAYFTPRLFGKVYKRYRVDFGLYSEALLEADLREQGIETAQGHQVH